MKRIIAVRTTTIIVIIIVVIKSVMIVIIVIVICSRIGSEHCIAQQITSSTFLSFYPNCEEKGCLGEKTTVLKIVVGSCALLF